MGRRRYLKPDFFKNEFLSELPPLARLAFAGLWCEADREGRLEDRPKRLKTDILPYDECNFDEILEILHQRGFIKRYQIGDSPYIWIPSFLEDQNPHPDEAKSKIPPYPGPTPAPAPTPSNDEKLDPIVSNETQLEKIISNGSKVGSREIMPLPRTCSSNLKKIKTLPPATKTPVSRLMYFFSEKCGELKNFKPEIDEGKDGGLLKKRLRDHSESELEALITWFLKSPESERLSPSLGVCLSANIFNKWQSQASSVTGKKSFDAAGRELKPLLDQGIKRIDGPGGVVL